MFDEVVLNLNLGCKLLAGHLVVGRFGENQTYSVVAISQSLDKLVIYDPSLKTSRNSQEVDFESNDGGKSEFETNDFGVGGDDTFTATNTSSTLDSQSTSNVSQSVYYIAVNDVIKTVSVRNFKPLFKVASPQATEEQANFVLDNSSSNNNSATEVLIDLSSSEPLPSKDLLLIGCSNSVLIYDAFSQVNLLSINTPTLISAITTSEPSSSSSSFPFTSRTAAATVVTNASGNNLMPTICGGSSRIYALKFDGNPTLIDGRNNNNFNAEISSERSTGDTINCLAQGTLKDFDLVLSGSLEHKIRLYLLDTFEQNIQPCKLTIEELAPINCICPINTVSSSSSSLVNNQQRPVVAQTSSLLPSIQTSQQQVVSHNNKEEMNYFAYGLENGIIGVYRLFLKLPADGPSSSVTANLSSERLWRHKCKHNPLTMLMYDINGDGLDELIIGFGNSSRIEARSPFTGQLLATTRCFKVDRLAGLTVIDYHMDGKLMLIACSVSGSLVGFKPKVCRPHKPLQGYTMPVKRQQQSDLLLEEFSVDVQLLDWQQQQAEAAATDVSVTNLKTIEEEQDVFMMSKGVGGGGDSAADLHIETQNDDTKPGKCDARQSHELLLRINALRKEQMDLEKKACHIYHKSLQQVADYYPMDMDFRYKWDFLPNKASLRLTIVISSSEDEIKLIEFEDKSENVLPKAHLFKHSNELKTSLVNANDGDMRSTNQQPQVVVEMPIRTKKDFESKLLIRIFCQSKQSIGGDEELVCRVYIKSIDVPKFSMITFAPELKAEDKKVANEISDAQEKQIRISFKLKNPSSQLAQISDWLNKSFLCFQFGYLFKNGINNSTWSWKQGISTTTDTLSGSSKQYNPILLDDTEDFNLNLIDIRHTLKKMVEEDKTNESSGKSSSTNNNLRNLNDETYPLEKVEVKAEEELKSEYERLASKLRITYSSYSSSSSTEQEEGGGGGRRNGEGELRFESENSDLVVALVQSLVIDRLHLNPSAATSTSAATTTDNKLLHHHQRQQQQQQQQENEMVVLDVYVEPILNELDTLTRSSRELEESERRIQTELYESADYTKNLMQQFAIANELNEFTIGKELLNELFMMLSGAQNAAKAQCLNNRSRMEISKQVNELKEKLTFLSSHFV